MFEVIFHAVRLAVRVRENKIVCLIVTDRTYSNTLYFFIAHVIVFYDVFS